MYCNNNKLFVNIIITNIFEDLRNYINTLLSLCIYIFNYLYKRYYIKWIRKEFSVSILGYVRQDKALNIHLGLCETGCDITYVYKINFFTSRGALASIDNSGPHHYFFFCFSNPTTKLLSISVKKKKSSLGRGPFHIFKLI